MEADWEMEIGGDAPVIEAYWPGFVNLRDEPWRVNEIAETHEVSGLAAALLRLNGLKSPVWTSKSDVFLLDEFDPDELSATREEAKFAMACYVDLLMRSDQIWSFPFKAEQACRAICDGLREVPLRCCRVDLVVRRALVADVNDLGATIYLTGCGRTLEDARNRLGECLDAFARVIAP
jgi:hypothetical protein